ncbi:hypothetical protein AND4_19052 [Vibrio sp. AND4]|nr:hypothetical protein AND4_19052 [Vibrio sp. AND4]
MKHKFVNTTACAVRISAVRSTFDAIQQNPTGSLDLINP